MKTFMFVSYKRKMSCFFHQDFSGTSKYVEGSNNDVKKISRVPAACKPDIIRATLGITKLQM